jgi:Flp pilus assembly secretin CpaC
MRFALWRVIAFAAVLAVTAALTPCVQAQAANRPYLGPYSVYNSNLTALKPAFANQPAFVNQPTFTTLGVQTTVTVPDGGSVLMGSYSRVSEGRNEFGAPILGKIPYVDRGFRNVGYGKDVVNAKIIASVRITSLEEEEFRQTGVRSGR